MIMNFAMEVNLYHLGILVALMTSFTLAIPTGYNGLQNDDISRLSKLISKISKIRENRNDIIDSKPKDTEKQQRENYGLLLSLNEPIKIEEVPSGHIINSKPDQKSSDSTGLEKRQGLWDYDYGLGGGRFGKRGFGDYALGGGRFGRDVDHVDPVEPPQFDAE